MSYEKETEYSDYHGNMYDVVYSYIFNHDCLEVDSYGIYEAGTDNEVYLTTNDRKKILKIIESELEKELHLNLINYVADHNEAIGDQQYDSWKDSQYD